VKIKLEAKGLNLRTGRPGCFVAQYEASYFFWKYNPDPLQWRWSVVQGIGETEESAIDSLKFHEKENRRRGYVSTPEMERQVKCTSV